MKRGFFLRCVCVFSALLFSFIFSFAAPKVSSNDEVTLTVQGYGSTDDQATLSALRSAIEQTFGTFVSSNTEILNDELVKDEVVSVSSGNVKHYDKLATTFLPDGQVMVTLRATVSITNLVSFAKSKGSKAEFAGQTFAMNIKLMDLRERNTVTAFRTMCEEAIALMENAFDYEISLSEPVAAEKRCYPVTAISPRYSSYSESFSKKETGYLLKARVTVKSNESNEAIYHLIMNTLSSLALNKDEISSYKKIGRNMFSVQSMDVALLDEIIDATKGKGLILPISEKENVDALKYYNQVLNRAAIISFFRCVIQDLGNSDNAYYWKYSLDMSDIVVDIRRANDSALRIIPRHLFEEAATSAFWLTNVITNENHDYFRISNDTIRESSYYGDFDSNGEFGFSFNSLVSSENWQMWPKQKEIAHYDLVFFFSKTDMLSFSGFEIYKLRVAQ